MMIIFTDHALLKLRQRGISRQIVVQTLKNPDQEQPGHKLRLIRYKKFKKLLMAVVFVAEAHDVIVITAHWVERIA